LRVRGREISPEWARYEPTRQVSCHQNWQLTDTSDLYEAGPAGLSGRVQPMSETVSLATRLTPQEAADVVSTALAHLRARVEAIAASSHQAAVVDGVADIAVFGRRSAVLNTWAVHAFFYDLGGTCGVELVALGQCGLVGAVGRTGAPSLSRSVRRMAALVAELRARDPYVELIA
jgi:hypothetical protein